MSLYKTSLTILLLMNFIGSSPKVSTKKESFTPQDCNTYKSKFDNAIAKSLNQAELFDFWVGKWDATWDEGNGKIGKGTNRITKTLDGKVIHENFQIIEGKSKGFKGTSISVYQPKLKRWKQAWADNNGGYYDFTGEFENNARIFKTQNIEKDGKLTTARMVFKDIKEDSFLWDWESSDDNGNTWKLLWRIHYKRIK
nr:hypothetical protein [uncultured Allomuricauda sp.]